jgi:hypothetical protein
MVVGVLNQISGVAKPSLICDWSTEGLKKYYDEKVVRRSILSRFGAMIALITHHVHDR